MGEFGSEPLYRWPSLIDDECTTICKTVFHELQDPVDVVLRAAFEAGMQARHNGPQRPGFVPVGPLPRPDAGWIQVPLGDASCQCDQHTLDICEFPQGFFGERHSAAVVVWFDPDLVQPKSKVDGNGRVAGLVMGQEAEFADAPFSRGSLAQRRQSGPALF